VRAASRPAPLSPDSGAFALRGGPSWATEVASVIPETVTVTGSELFDLAVRLMRAEGRILKENERQETEGTGILGETIGWFYGLVFDMFIDRDLPEKLEAPDCFARIWRQAARAAGGMNAEKAA